MNRWLTKPLGDLVSLEYGKALKAEERSENGHYPVYGSNGIVGSFYEALVKDPTIVVGRKGAIGEAHFAQNGCWPIDTSFYTVVREPGTISLPFLLLWFRSVDLKTLAITSTIPGLNRTTLYSQKVPVPPLAEQERIVKLLDEADELRKLRAQADRRTAALIPALFHEMFGDPARNPKRWQLKPLGKVGKLARGRSRHRPRDEPSLYGGPYPFIQTGDVSNSEGVITHYLQTYSKAGLAQSRMWPTGTLCITIAANIAKTAMLTFDACFPDSVVGFIPSGEVLVEYVRDWFVTMEEQLEDAAPQSAQKNINLAILNALVIPVPPLPLQRQFAARVAEFRALETEQAASRRRLDDLFQSMLHRAFRGEL